MAYRTMVIEQGVSYTYTVQWPTVQWSLNRVWVILIQYNDHGQITETSPLDISNCMRRRKTNAHATRAGSVSQSDGQRLRCDGGHGCVYIHTHIHMLMYIIHRKIDILLSRWRWRYNRDTVTFDIQKRTPTSVREHLRGCEMEAMAKHT